MKRHTRLFEEFSQDTGLWALMFHPDGVMYGLYDTEEEALAARGQMNDWTAAMSREEYGEDEPYEEEDLIDVQQVFPGSDPEQDAELFSYAISAGSNDVDFPGQADHEMVWKLIELGADPMKFFTAEQLIDLFRDRLDELPSDFRNLLFRSRKSDKLFGI